MKKINVAVIFGGRSGEHEVSLMSATNIINAIEKEKYEVSMIGITREGQWRAFDGPIANIITSEWENDSTLFDISKFMNPNEKNMIDVVFPVLHGPNGEDGTVQGFFELCNIPYVGCGVLASAMCMDKEIAKKLFAYAGLGVGPYTLVRSGDIEAYEGEHDYPVFVKPANMGSSVGISKVKGPEELKVALREAAKYDKKILIESTILGREVECAVLGNETPLASGIGEIIPSHDFYDYTAKYFDGDNSRVLIPAEIEKEKEEEIREAAITAYKALNCRGLARVDFFIEKNTEKVLINEINTMPGFTRISMYPKLWQEKGLSYSTLIDQLIQLALER